MSEPHDDFELIRGSGNVFRDFGDPDADVLQMKSILAARIIGILDDEGLSTRKAQERTGVNYSDFARIRNAKLSRFTIDRLVTILNRLGCEVEMQVKIQRRPAPAESALAQA
jgi:predicted XRE-type DNA-binding protein